MKYTGAIITDLLLLVLLVGVLFVGYEIWGFYQNILTIGEWN